MPETQGLVLRAAITTSLVRNTRAQYGYISLIDNDKQAKEAEAPGGPFCVTRRMGAPCTFSGNLAPSAAQKDKRPSRDRLIIPCSSEII